MRRYFITSMALLCLLVISANAHSLWVEAKDSVDTGEPLKVYSLFGHTTSSTGIYVPLMDYHYLITPSGKQLDLTTQTGDWLPGFGWIEYSFADVVLHTPGDYVFAAVKTPGVSVRRSRLSSSFAKSIIHVGDDGAENGGNWNAGFPFEITMEQAPYEIEAMDNVTFVAKYEDQPVNATYSAYYWTWNAHSDEGVQTGDTGDDGDFTVNFSQGGPWLVTASYYIPGDGEWIATYDSGDDYKVGDVVPYNITRYSSTLSVWVR